jgi:hypothetical protein
MEDNKPYSDTPLNRDEEREVDIMVEQALKQIDRGADPQAALANILMFLPSHLQKQARQRLASRLEQRRTRNRTAVATKTSTSLKQVITLIAQRALERIMALLRAKPDVQRNVVEAGRTLLRNGVAVDMARVTEEELGTLSPSATIAPARQQETQR